MRVPKRPPYRESDLTRAQRRAREAPLSFARRRNQSRSRHRRVAQAGGAPRPRAWRLCRRNGAQSRAWTPERLAWAPTPPSSAAPRIPSLPRDAYDDRKRESDDDRKISGSAPTAAECRKSSQKRSRTRRESSAHLSKPPRLTLILATSRRKIGAEASETRKTRHATRIPLAPKGFPGQT